MKKLIAFGFVLFATLGLFAQDRRPEIGDIGPGGGMIFYWHLDEETGEYLYGECSGDLGRATWGQAIIDARNYRGGGFDDWRLPDSNDSNWMYRNLKLSGIGGFANSFYWVNIERYSADAYGFNFRNGDDFAHRRKTTQQLFRAVRLFIWKPSE